jgi:hypothetical protein
MSNQPITYPVVRVRISRLFWEDHTYNRDLPGGVLVRQMARLVEVDLTRWEALAIWSDAEYWSEIECKEQLAEQGAFVKCAQRVLAKMEAIELPEGPNEEPAVEVEASVVDVEAQARVARRQAIRAQHELEDDVSPTWFRLTCGCGKRWEGTRDEVSSALDEWEAHREEMSADA